METIKINFKYFFEGFDKEKNFFTDILRKKYKVIISDEPNYLFYSVYSPTRISKDISGIGDIIRNISPKLYIFLKEIYSRLNTIKKRTKLLEGNYFKIFYGTENVKPNMNECDFAFSSYFEEEINHLNYFRIPAIVCDYPFEEDTRLPLKRKINFNKIKKEKVKFCNFIYSQDINKRNDFFKKLNSYKHIDSPGRCMNNMPPISSKSSRESRLSKNWVKDKLDFIKNYKFTIAFENKIQNGWITEKLSHPLLVDSIPIYVGSKSVRKDFNTKAFINFSDFKSMKEFIEHIIKVDNDDKLYQEYLEQAFFINKKQHYFNSKKRFEDKLYEIIESGKN